MKLSTSEDIDAPREHVFAQLTEFELFEDAFRRRGVKVKRLDDSAMPSAGMRWHGAFDWHGVHREVEATLTTLDAPEKMAVQMKSQGFEGHFIAELTTLSQTRTRLQITLEVTPLSLPARVLLQSLKLAKDKLHRTMRNKVASFARNIERSAPRQA